jgi:Secretion system C-terminal sorting domain/Pregnancy-associated plasma protein-A
VLCLALLCNDAYAQSTGPNFICGTPRSINVSLAPEPETSLATLRTGCTSSTATKFIKVNVQFILRSDGTGNYSETSDGLGGPVNGYQAAYELIKTANLLMANNPQVYQPLNNTTPALATRIQYQLQGVHFIRNTTLYNEPSGAFLLNFDLIPHLVNENSEINIFIAGGPVGFSAAVQRTGRLFTSPFDTDPIMLLGEQMWSSFNQGFTKPVYFQSTPLLYKYFYYAQNINHEMGHLLNLHHVFQQDFCNNVACPPYPASNPIFCSSDPDACTDTHTFCPRSNFEPIPPQTNPFNNTSCPTAFCSNTFMDYSLNHFAVTPCQITRMHTEIQTTIGMNYYDCSCPTLSAAFSLANGNYTIYSNGVFLDCSHPGNNVEVFIDASATQNENGYQITVEDMNIGVVYTKTYYGQASTLNLLYVCPTMQVNRVYRVRVTALSTCTQQQYAEQVIQIQYNFGCGGWFLRSSPNPASETLTIDYGIGTEKEVDTELIITELNNPKNQKVLKAKTKEAKGKHQVVVNIGNLNKGLYIVTLKTPEKILSEKLEIFH